MLKMVDGTGIIGVDMVCPLGGTVSPPQPPNYDKVEVEGVGSLMLPNSLKAPLERVELLGNSVQGENPSPDNPQKIKSAGKYDEASRKYLFDVKVTGKNIFNKNAVKQGYDFRINGEIKDLDKVQVEEGNQTTDYEPYQESQTLTLVSDRPITKWDKLVEQGGEYGWLYQSAIDTDVKPSRVDLFPNGFSLFKDYDNGVHVYKVTNIKKAIGFQTSLCEQFKNKDGSYSTGDLFCYSDQPSMQMQYFVTNISTLENFKTWMETNPLTMVYKTTQAEFIPLSESEQTQLRNLHSYSGTTNIMVDSGEVPCGIKLTYRKEK